MLLHLLRSTSDADVLNRIHAALEQGIFSASKRIKDVNSGDQWYQDLVIDEECDNIEELLGLAFVAAQTLITAVRTEIVAVSRASVRDLERPLSFVSGNKGYNILEIGAPMGARLSFTQVEAVNAVANY